MVGAAVKGKSNNSLSSYQPTKHYKPGVKTALAVPSLKIFAEPTANIAHQHSLTDPAPADEFKKLSLTEGRHKGTASSSKSALKNFEKNKGKLDNSVKPNARRKVLTDISNVRKSLSRNKVQDKPKPLCSSRNSLVGTQAASCSTRKPFNGSRMTNSTRFEGIHQTVKRIGTEGTKTTFDDHKTKNENGQLVSTSNSRTSGGHCPPPTRKSFPATKQVKKESTERSQRGNEKYELSENSNDGRTVISQVSSYRNYLVKSRVSDGRIMLASKGRSNVDVGSSRRSIKLMQTMRMTNSKTERTLNSRIVSGFKKPPATYDISSKKNDEKAKLSSAKIIGKEEVPSFTKCDLEKTTADNVTSRKSGRRKSFTSLLTSKEDLPNIYNAQNHLEVSEYIDDIYQYYWVMEAEKQPFKQYMDIQTELTPHMRGILINWLIEVHLKFDLMQETLFLMVTLLDQFLSCVSIKKSKMQLVGLTALLLASKYEDFWHPRIMDLIGVSADSYTRDEMLTMENAFLKTLKFRLNAPTPYVFMLRSIRAAQSNKTFEHLAFYLIELCLVEYEALKYKPSLLCASAIYLARCTMQMSPTWTPLLQKHTRYEEDQIRQCAEMILKFHKSTKTTLLRVTCEKYTRPEFSRVAAINPLEMLPQG